MNDWTPDRAATRAMIITLRRERDDFQSKLNKLRKKHIRLKKKLMDLPVTEVMENKFIKERNTTITVKNRYVLFDSVLDLLGVRDDNDED